MRILRRSHGPLPKTDQLAWTRYLINTFGGKALEPSDRTNDYFCPSEEQISHALSRMSDSKACGPDGISPYHLKALPPWCIQAIFAQWIQQGNIPQESNSSEIIPIYKSGDSSQPENFRPISLINTIIKLLELTILEAIDNRNELLSTKQYGATQSKSALLQYEQVSATLCSQLDHQQDIWLLLVDFQKAFDSVDRQRLMEKLTLKGIPTPILNTIHMTLCNQRTRISNTDMQWIPMLKGVRQGSPLSPFLFNVYVDDIETISSPPPRMYLDDMAFPILRGSFIDFTVARLNKWSAENSLKLNLGPNKTALIHFTNKRSTQPFSQPVPSTEAYRYLGKQI
jgi:hypothetical protein